MRSLYGEDGLDEAGWERSMAKATTPQPRCSYARDGLGFAYEVLLEGRIVASGWVGGSRRDAQLAAHDRIATWRVTGQWLTEVPR